MGAIPLLCINCDKDCTSHNWTCKQDTVAWCPECFEKTACHSGVHGDKCAERFIDRNAFHCQ